MSNRKGEEIEIKVYRDGLSTPWGFRLQGGLDFDSPLIVQRVVPLSAVDGSLRPGDIILKIDNYDATRLPHNAALNLIANAGSTMNLTIVRTDSVLNGQVCRGERARSQPKTYGRFSPRGQQLEQQQQQDEESVEQAKKLASIMKESLRVHEPGHFQPSRIASEKFTPSIQPWPNRQPTDVTSYLPQLPPKRGPTPLLLGRGGHGGAGGAKDAQMKLQLRDTLMMQHQRCQLSPDSSGRSSPSTSSVIELGPPDDPNRPIGVWTPPLHHPNSRLVHLQYNSPLNVYSAYNVADTVEKMTGSKLEWLKNPPSARYLDDIRESATYKLVQEIEGRSAPKTTTGNVFGQSATLKNMSRFFGVDEQAP